MHEDKLPISGSSLASMEDFSSNTQKQCVSIYKYLYTCCVGPDAYSLTDLFLLYVMLFSPPKYLHFMNHTCSLLFRKPCMYSSVGNTARSPAATSKLPKSN